MKARSIVLTGILALSSLSVIYAKSYDITFDNATKAGSAVLTPGEYRLKVEGSNAVFTNVRNEQKFTVPIKIEDASQKHESTAVESNQMKDGTQRIKAIELGGSTETLEFGE
jgi:hypothetical protein